MLLLQFPDTDDETRDAIGMVDGEQPLGKFARLIDIAIGQHREKGAAEQIGFLGSSFSTLR